MESSLSFESIGLRGAREVMEGDETRSMKEGVFSVCEIYFKGDSTPVSGVIEAKILIKNGKYIGGL